MIDISARKKYVERSKTNALIEGMKAAVTQAITQTSKNVAAQNDTAVKNTQTLAREMKDSVVAAVDKKQTGIEEETLRLIVERHDDPTTGNKITSIKGGIEETTAVFKKIADALPILKNSIPKPFILPKLFQIKGEVKVTDQPPVKIENLRELEKYFQSLEQTFKSLMLAVQSMPQPQIKLPKFEIPTQVKADNPELLKLLENLNEKIDNLQSPEPVSMRQTNELLQSLVNRPQMVNQPVTNININGLQGFGKSTSQTVTTTRSQLPAYGQLLNRRSMIIFNNDTSNTLYVGGSDVTTGNGLPVLAQTFSPAIDAGYNLIVYGVSNASCDVRVFEVSKDTTGTVQE